MKTRRIKRILCLCLSVMLTAATVYIPIDASEGVDLETGFDRIAFADNFESGILDAEQWIKHNNAPKNGMTIENGKMKITSGNQSCAVASIGEMEFSDAIYEFDISNVNAQTAGGFAAILFNREKTTDRWDNSGYLLHLLQDGTLTLYHTNKYVKLGQSKISGHDTLEGVHVKMIVNEGLISIYADSILQFMAAMPATERTRGYIAYTMNGNGNSMYLDNVTIRALPSQIYGMSVKQMPDKSEYTVNEELDVLGGRLAIAYEDGTKETIEMSDPLVSITGYDKTTAGTQEITVEYKNTFTSFDVSVISKNMVTSVLADIPEGTYEQPQTVTLSCATEGAQIYYTTDGSIPTSDSTEYVSPIRVNDNMVIKAVAIKSGMDNSVVSSFVYILDFIIQHGENPYILRPEREIDNLETLTAGAAAKNKEIGMFTAGTAKYFWTQNFGARQADYLEWTVQSDLQETSDYFAWFVINATTGTKFRLTVTQDNTTTMTEYTKEANGFETVEFGTIQIPAGVSQIRLTKVTPQNQNCQIKSLNIIRQSDKAAYEERIEAYRASGFETLERFKNQPYGVFYQLGDWGYPSIGPRKGSDEERVENFNVKEFVDLQKKMGAEFVVWSMTWWTYKTWQNVDAINEIMGHNDWTTERNLISEIAAECKKQGLDFYLYYHQGIQNNPEWAEKNQWPDNHPLYGTGDKSTFVNNWCNIITEIGTKIGTNLDGWLFDDGCNYFPAPFEKMAKATKAGNSGRIVAFNAWQGSKITEFQDMIFGEGTWGTAAQTENGIYTAGKEKGLQQIGMPTLGTDWGIHNMNQKTQLKVAANTIINNVKSAQERKVPIVLGIEIYEEGTINEAVFDAMMQLKQAIHPDITEPATEQVSSIEVLAQQYTADSGGNLQLKASVKPQYATNKEIEWKVLDDNGFETDLASISETGLLTAGSVNGKVKVRAVSKDNSDIFGEAMIEITGGTEMPTQPAAVNLRGGQNGVRRTK